MSSTAVLAAWEAGQGDTPLGRARAVLWHAVTEAERDALDEWTIGRRDARLLDVHAATFGEEIAGLVACPQCGEQLEIALRPDDIRSPYGDAATRYEWSGDDAYRVVFRLPSSADLRAGASQGSEEAARRALLESCVLVAERAGEAVPPEDLPDAVSARIEEAMAQHDAQADTQLALTCPACEHAWQAPFDIADFLWREVAAQARQLANDVHTLALAYGWREADILALSDARRKMYLELLLG
ncbi:MAG TPA: hypothetical protein VEX13_17435 [Chloroflexia bacterium]|nr:hypothetical protein [Chloroflexia bacterium]